MKRKNFVYQKRKQPSTLKIEMEKMASGRGKCVFYIYKTYNVASFSRHKKVPLISYLMRTAEREYNLRHKAREWHSLLPSK